MEVVPFRRRLVRAVVFLVVVLTITATGLSARLSETMSREREALMLVSQLERAGGAEAVRVEEVTRLSAMSARVFERADADDTLWRWGFFEDRSAGAWASVQRPGAAPLVLSAASPGETPEMAQTVAVRLVFGAGILAWLTFWAGLLVTQRATRRLQDSATQLVHAWTHDGQTGLLGRDRLLELVDTSEGRETGALISVALVDHNEQHDTLGPGYADSALEQLVERMQRAAPNEARIGRTATDVLTAWLPDHEADRSVAVARAMHDALHQPLNVEGFPLLPTVSIGVAARPRDGREARVLLARAGRASRSTEAATTGVAEYDASMEADQERGLWLRPLLRSAIEARRVTLSYQPKVDARTGHIVGVEALARWTDVDRGPIRPDHFIAVAEQSGQIHALTRQLLEQAVEQAARLKRLRAVCPIAVNVSALCMGEPALEHHLDRLLAQHQLHPSDLEIEITETAALARPAQTRDQLERLKRQGMRIAIDDFGTGQSSLAQLALLPVDDIKIDQAFIRPLRADAPESEPAWRLVAGIVRLAESLDRSTTAEGVEDAEVGGRLSEIGCSSLQGWAYSKAVTGPELEQLLRVRHTYPIPRSSGA